MSNNDIEQFYKDRFNQEPENDPSYFEEWEGRLTGLRSMGEISPHMDFQSRRVWGRVTGQKLGYIVLLGWDGPVYQLVNLQTGLDIGEAVRPAKKGEEK